VSIAFEVQPANRYAGMGKVMSAVVDALVDRYTDEGWDASVVFDQIERNEPDEGVLWDQFLGPAVDALADQLGLAPFPPENQPPKEIPIIQTTPIAIKDDNNRHLVVNRATDSDDNVVISFSDTPEITGRDAIGIPPADARKMAAALIAAAEVIEGA
jgi:hypothetical protein